MRRIFAIGGGEAGIEETLTMDKAIVAAAGKDTPKLLFIPTASYDAQGYVENIKDLYGGRLGCEVDALLLISEAPDEKAIKSKIQWADIVYVGGGNTRNMLKVWRENGVDRMLREAYEQGTVMSGLSAGSICWFAKGHSDSDTYEAGENRPYSIVEGMGWIPLFHCPHHNEDTREEDFDEKIVSSGEVGLAIENNCAIEILDNTFRIIHSDEKAKAYKIYEIDGVAVRETLPCQEAYLPLDRLLNR